VDTGTARPVEKSKTQTEIKGEMSYWPGANDGQGDTAEI
jgi:hypothetical protein